MKDSVKEAAIEAGVIGFANRDRDRVLEAGYPITDAALTSNNIKSIWGEDGYNEWADDVAIVLDALEAAGLTITDAARLAELENFFDGAHIRMWNLTAQKTPEYRVVWPQRIMSSEQAKALWPTPKADK